MTTLRRLSVLTCRPTGRAAQLLDRMRSKAGHDATFFTVKSRPQADRSKARP